MRVKSDFISDMPNVLPLGLVGPMNLVQMEQHALEVIASYKNYSLIGFLAPNQLQRFRIGSMAKAEVKLISTRCYYSGTSETRKK